ncbi:hypothetical protein [Dactylosporangium cerinum]
MTALLLRHAVVVDTRDGSLRPGTDVLTDGGTITAVGTGLDAPRDATVVDATGRYVVPGYNDMHAHPLGVSPGGLESTLELMLAHGITGYRQMHDDLHCCAPAPPANCGSRPRRRRCSRCPGRC